MRKDYKALANSPGTVGLEVVLSLAFGYFGGHWLDGRFGTGPYLAIVGFAAGVGAAIRGIHRTWKHMQAVARQEEKVEGNPSPILDDEPARLQRPNREKKEPNP